MGYADFKSNQGRLGVKPNGAMPELFFLMAIFSQTLFAFVGCHFMTFSFFTARHKGFGLRINLT